MSILRSTLRLLGGLFSLIRFPLLTVLQYLREPWRSLTNTKVVFAAFWRTMYVGKRALRVLRDHEFTWSDERRGKYIWRVARRFWARWILDVAGIELIIEGGEYIDWSRPHVLAVNHQSTFDPFGLIVAIPLARFVGKKEILWYPIIGSAARRGAQVIIDRKNHHAALASIARAVDAWPDSNIIFFVEGTRTRTGELLPFKMGAFHLAVDWQFPVVPVCITGAWEALPKGSLLRLRSGNKIRVRFGEPLLSDDPYALRDLARMQITSMLEQSEP